jgi:hypothetical protein
MSKGFIWICQNTDSTDYIKCSIELARSIKQHNRENKICVLVDDKSIFESKHVDMVQVLPKDHSVDHAQKFANEYQVFAQSPFTHSIKLEADMLWTGNTDWWWYHLWQHDLIFSVNCLNYRNQTVVDTTYRKIFTQNNLPNIYNGLTYFRRSQRAKQFFLLCQQLTENWSQVRDNLLINCHDAYPTTDVIYALAYRIMDPTNEQLIDYPWFKFVHGKPAINLSPVADCNNYLHPVRLDDRLYLGGRRLNQVWHYHDKNIPEVLNARTF